jgi:hypothetical protein
MNWHDDEMSLKGTATLGRFGVSAQLNQIQLRYSLTTGFGMADTITPQSSLFVGLTNFGKDLTQTGQQQGQDKPVSVEWVMSPTSRIELSGPSLRGLRPLVVSEWSSLTVTGVKDDGGKPKTDSELLRGSFWGLGGEISVAGPGYSRGTALVCGSDKYSFADLSYLQCFTENIAFRIGYQWRTLKFERTTVRINGGYAGVEIPVRFP